jgi:hypothetical protein
MGTQSSPAIVLPARMLHVPFQAARLAAKEAHIAQTSNGEGSSGIVTMWATAGRPADSRA